jgi:hypothetical protein
VDCREAVSVHVCCPTEILVCRLDSPVDVVCLYVTEATDVRDDLSYLLSGDVDPDSPAGAKLEGAERQPVASDIDHGRTSRGIRSHISVKVKDH